MPPTPRLRHCSNKYKLAREGEKDKEKDEQQHVAVVVIVVVVLMRKGFCYCYKPKNPFLRLFTTILRVYAITDQCEEPFPITSSRNINWFNECVRNILNQINILLL